jgi:wyosine [tRNA(Phe)-imidazoG37] synthetase (radical SAM superfamily)
MMDNFKYIYGPVFSWRLGSSLGIDLLSQEDKICNFDCIYCQLGPTKRHALNRKTYVPIKEVVEELERLPALPLDYISFSGRGEPTLAENLGQAIKAIKLIRKVPVAVLTNSSLMDKEEVRKELALADFVVAKLDTFSPESLQEINHPAQDIEFASILDGLKEFRNDYRGRLALQIMFIDKNKDNITKFIYLVNYIKPDEVQINTPLRPCKIKPLSKEELFRIKDSFSRVCKGMNIISLYDERTPKEVFAVSDEDTLKRRGKI